MNEIEKEIEEMAREIAKRDCYLFEKCPKEPKHNCLSQDTSIMIESSKPYITFATWLFNAGYRNCKVKVVLDKEEYEEIKRTLYKTNEFYGNLILENQMLKDKLENKSKETAREIVEKIYNFIPKRETTDIEIKVSSLEDVNKAVLTLYQAYKNKVKDLAKQYGVEVE